MKKLYLLMFALLPISLFSQNVIMGDVANVTQCSDNFYDSGADAGDHAINTTSTITICPDIAGQFTTINFSEFEVGAGSTMTIYNASTVDPAFEIGQFTGTDSPGFVRATSESTGSCLTIVFEAGDTAASGWNGFINCSVPNIISGYDYQTTGTYIQCSGNFYDNGEWNNGGYVDGDIEIVTICSDQPGQVTEVDFTQFLLSEDDVLNIYDGDSTGAPLIGSYQNSNNPGLLFASSTNTSGCLTFEFVPDGAFSPVAGWEATIGCREPCQEITAQIDSVTPSEFNAGVYTVVFNESILFQGSGIFADGDGTGATYEWDFGDGNTGIGQDTAHTYAQIGTYDVTLVVYDQNSCPSDLLEFTVEVESNSASFCDDLNPFCAGSDALVFPNGNPQSGGEPTAENGPNYGCLGSEPWPAWFYLQIDEPGDLDFTLAQNTSPDFNGTGLDVDFIVWGPFTEPDGNCDNLTAANTVDCSYSAVSVEDVSIPNAQTGEIYIILITNFNQGAGYISLQQVGGAGTTDCSILDTTLGDDQELCEGEDYTIDGTTIGATGYQWSIFNETTGEYDPILGETNPVITVNTTGIYQVETNDGDGDTSFDEVEIIFYDIATIETLNDMEDCVTSDITTIDISQDADILGTQDPTEFNITYYNTQAEADAGTGNIPDPTNYAFTANTAETIFIRVENVNKADCYITDSFELEISVVSIGENMVNLEECDDDNDGDGIFDLTENEVLALDGLDSATYTVTYYETQNAADLGAPEIPTPTAYENANANPQEIFVRVSNNTDLDCYATDSFFVESFAIGEVNPVEDMDICDNTGAGVDFDLTTNTTLVLGGQDPADFAVTYYTTQAEADAGTPEIADPANYTVVNEGTQTIFIRLENVDNTDCFNTTSFEVNLTLVEVGALDDLEECDADSNGSALFDLTQNTTNALNGADPANYSVSYYLTQAEADVPENEVPFPTTYQNVNNNPQEIFVRVENNTDSDCFDTSSFMVESFPSGVANDAEDLQLCDNGTGGPYEFDLTTNTPLVLGTQDPNLFDIAYYTNEADAEVPQNEITTPTNYPATAGLETIYVRIDNANKPECFSLNSFTLRVNEVRIGEVTDKEECDGGNTGFATFNLTNSNIEALDGQSPLDYEVTYYASQADLDAGVAIATPATYENLSNPQEIFVQVAVDGDADCFLTTSFMIEATTSAPIFDPSPLVACDTDNDGFYTLFDLTEKDDEITNSNPDVTVTYHLTPSDANNGVNVVSSPYSNVVPYNQTIYVRVEDPANGCVLNTTLELEVYDSPQIAIPEPLEVCDDDDDEQAFFDLTVVEEEVLDGLDPNSYDITYHDDEQEAEDGVDAIINIGSYENAFNPQIIWIRVTDPNTPTGCYTVVELELIVNPLPIANQPTNLELCDDELSGSDTDELSVFDLTVKESEITGNNNSIEVIWYETPTDLDAGIEILDPTAYTNVIATNQTIVAQLVDENGCSVTTTLTLVVNPLPSPTPTDQLDPYELCDDDNDGFVEFDLDTQDDLIANGEADIEVTYYATPEGAEGGLEQNQIGPLYENVQINQQTIYARATNTLTECYRWVGLDLVVTPLPMIDGTLEDIFACDATGDTFQNFDITQNEEFIYGTQDPSLFNIAYYESETNAIDEENPISTPTNYSNGGISPLTVWVRLENNDTECYRIASFDLITGEAPVIVNPSPLEACDDSATTPTDEIGLFDLTQAIPEITNGNNNLDVFFYESVVDMDNDNPINPANAYQNITNAQTLQVKVVSDAGCESFTTLTLVVNPNPSIAEDLEALEVCDDDNDGFAEFDLEVETVIILDGEPNVTITYHTTLANAENGVDAIDTTEPYTNVNINIQTIYVRAENTGITGNGTNCFVTRTLELIVIAAPVLEPEGLEDLYVCDDDSADGFAVFNLTQNEDLMFGDQDPTNLVITYHENLSSAEEGTPKIAVPTNYTNIVNPQMIWVRIENTETGCIDAFVLNNENTFTLYVEEIPELTQPTPLQVCDDDYANDPLSQVEFDLTVKEAEIAGMDPVTDNLVFTYYASAADQASGTPINTPEAYVNQANPQTIFIEVADTNTENSCINEITLTIEVLPLPTPSEDSLEALRQEQCDDNNDGIAPIPFDLTQSGDLISDGENVVISYYKTEEAVDAEDAAELIATPEAYVNEPAYNTLNNDGTPTNTQIIYARVDSDATGNFCYVVVPFELIVYPEPVFNPAGDPFGYTLCEDGTSGTAAVELIDIAGNLYDATFEADGNPDTTADPTVLIPLLDQDPATNANQDLDIENYIFTYYFSLADAQAGVNAIPNGFVISDNTTIWVSISNSFGCTSDEFGEILVQVEPRPSIDDTPLLIDDLCSDEQGGNTATIDLTQYSDQINPGAPANTQINYYASMQDYLDGLVIETPSDYMTESNPQTIITEVIHTGTLCESASIKEITLEVNETPTVDITSYDGTIICFDSNPATEVIGGNYDPIIINTGLDESIYDFVWTIDGVDQNNNSASFEVTQPGVVAVEVTNTTNPGMCSSSSEAIFFENNPPEFDASIETISFNGSHSVLISNVTGSGNYEFSVDNGPWIALGEDGTLVIDGLAGGEHEILGRDQGGCGATLKVISFIDYPAFFTPNEDGYNDRWNIQGISNQLDAKIYIFDRYGKLLKQLSPSSEGWDGTFNGTSMPSNDYWFRVEYTDVDGTRKEFKANFTLKR